MRILRLMLLITGLGLGAVSAQTPSGVHILWRCEGATNPSYEWVSMSAIGNRTVYSVLPGKTWSYTTENGSFTETGSTIVALNLPTGQVRWSAESSWPVLSPLLLSGRRLVAHNGYDEIFCFDASDGTLLWKVEPELHPGSWDERTMPSADGRFIYLREGNDIVCRSALDGKPVWRTEVVAVRNLRIFASLASGRVFVSDGMEAVIALDSQDARILWRKPLPAIRDLFITASEAVLVSDPDRTFGLAAADGRELFNYGQPPREILLGARGGKSVWNVENARALAVQGSNIFLIQNRVIYPEGKTVAMEIACLDAANAHANRWTEPVANEFEGLSLAGPFVLTVEAGKVIARDAATGNTVWEFQVPGENHLQGQPLAADGKIIVAGSKGLICIETGDMRITGWPQSGGSAARMYAGR